MAPDPVSGARSIDGVAVARELRQALRARVAAMTEGRRPGLAVLLVGDDPASAVYVRNKIRACEEVGIASFAERLPAATSEAQVLATIARFNADPAVHGILVQLPLPRHIDTARVLAAVAPAKDVDGFGVESQGALLGGLPGLRPCTPAGVMRLLAAAGTPLRGARAVVLGRSTIVGKPMAMLLLQADATVTVCHSATRDLAALTREADVLVAAIGRPRFVTADMVKPGATVIDVGINRDADGRLCGDVDFEAVRPIAGAITPVPGGVGPMTIAMLLANTVDAAGLDGGPTGSPSAPSAARLL
ncbi:bifunctional methylenetetrahydrofolate dehydrogenase/methenyltetrahydrofolate cyclohydrolase FolD [Mitsuaria sp. GD03876]|uniref:bifunctional methylenetetrahydrofolate dehydrogenase/methenyltetrahydrofolate cyclohydrolase FolD n=1 Tax=Mitsuaria sp. GD03876 TaxID=2975399 RepID=UPI002449A304|nr:bifunctional methylenetetrahydrofolate dehydrogenase/methenyltetrahydrofolate cyclohydrolase FolD [Mitsuaria sp. GD03876]MDH0866260.1 bifunctional methylenetetrahydrofolate dehydrogenase/methenyltetrahydrofolate cyclohydrolase FolD [Mitsuaria sp. GD03876]